MNNFSEKSLNKKGHKATYNCPLELYIYTNIHICKTNIRIYIEKTRMHSIVQIDMSDNRLRRLN